MAKGYRPVNRDQPFLLPPDMREWLPVDHPVWLVIAVVEEHLDTSVLHARRRTGGAGRAGYHPDMLLALLVWAYANKVTSSRRIEGLCWRDVSFRVICAGDAPDHVTIARFRADFPAVMEQLFAQVLVLCARLGMGQLGTVALDGTKVAAAASKAANRTEERLRKLAADAVAGHAAADAAEDELFGEGVRGDEVPPEAADRRTRAGRIRAALAELEAERAAAAGRKDGTARAYLDDARAGRLRRGNVPARAVVAAAQEKVARAEAAARARVSAREQRDAEAAAAGRRGFGGKRPAPPQESASVRKARAALDEATARAGRAERAAAGKKKGPGPVRNITDVDARLMPVRGGTFIQGYNAQNVTSEDGLIIATAHTQDTGDSGCFGPMLAQAQEAAALIIASRPRPGDDDGIGLILADAGYLSVRNLTMDGPDRLIAVGKHRDLEKDARDEHPSGRDGPIGLMAARLRTEQGITAYRQRGHIAETPHGHIKHNLGFRQHTMRGLPKTAAEWKFTCAVHNLLKAISTGHLTTAALAT